jgi:hypothetical protein
MGGLWVGPEKQKGKKETAQETHVPWAREKERKKEKHPGDKRLLGLSPHHALFPLLPISLGVAGYTGGLDACGVGGVHVPPLFPCRLSPSHPLAICHLLVPLLFAIFSSPCHLPSSRPLTICCLLAPVPVIPIPIPVGVVPIVAMSSCGGGVIVPLSVAPLHGSRLWWVVLRHLGVMWAQSRSLPIPLLVVVMVLVVPIVMVAMMAVVVLVLVVIQSFLVPLIVIILCRLVSNN